MLLVYLGDPVLNLENLVAYLILKKLHSLLMELFASLVLIPCLLTVVNDFESPHFKFVV